MDVAIFIWDLDDDPEANVQHLAEHGVTKDEAEYVVRHGTTDLSRTSDLPITSGYTSTGRHLAVVWQEVEQEPLIVAPVTAFEVPESGRSPKRRGRR